MSSFQSFKSFVKIQQNHNSSQNGYNGQTVPIKGQAQLGIDHELKNYQRNNSLSQSLRQSKQKQTKRTKRPGTVCNFISKIYTMLQQREIKHIVTWIESRSIETQINKKLQIQQINRGQNKCQLALGKGPDSFQILDIQKFQSLILPKYFKHSNLSSFVRQLNMYGFHKLRGEKNQYQFQHQKFQRNDTDGLSEIKRKSPEFTGVSMGNLSELSFKNLDEQFRFGDKKPLQINQMLLFSQYDIPPHKQQLERSIFPSQNFIQHKKKFNFMKQQAQSDISISLQRQRLRKITLLEQENSWLRKIKQNKFKKVKDLNGTNKSVTQIKFSKIILTVLTHKLKKEFNQKKPTFENEESKLSKNQKSTNFQKMVEHVIVNKPVQKFQSYKEKVSLLFQQSNELSL